MFASGCKSGAMRGFPEWSWWGLVFGVGEKGFRDDSEGEGEFALFNPCLVDPFDTGRC